MCAGHFFSFARRVFYLAVVVKQKCLLLLKKLVNFLHGIQTYRKSNEEVGMMLTKTSCKKIIQQSHLYSSENDLVSRLHHVLEEPTKHFFRIFSSYGELKRKNNEKNSTAKTAV